MNWPLLCRSASMGDWFQLLNPKNVAGMRPQWSCSWRGNGEWPHCLGKEIFLLLCGATGVKDDTVYPGFGVVGGPRPWEDAPPRVGQPETALRASVLLRLMASWLPRLDSVFPGSSWIASRRQRRPSSLALPARRLCHLFGGKGSGRRPTTCGHNATRDWPILVPSDFFLTAVGRHPVGKPQGGSVTAEPINFRVGQQHLAVRVTTPGWMRRLRHNVDDYIL